MIEQLIDECQTLAIALGAGPVQIGRNANPEQYYCTHTPTLGVGKAKYGRYNASISYYGGVRYGDNLEMVLRSLRDDLRNSVHFEHLKLQEALFAVERKETT
jgi:hypothetical protein